MIHSMKRSLAFTTRNILQTKEEKKVANFYYIIVTLIGGATKTFEGRLNTLAGPDEEGRKKFKELCQTLDAAEAIGIIEGYRVGYES